MTSIEKINLHKSSPTTLLVGGATNLGIEIANTLISNEGFVILVDEFSDTILSKFSELSKSDYFLFLDKSSLDEISRNLVRLDYIFYVIEDSQDPSKVISSDYFLQSSNSLNTVLKLAIRYKSRFELITSILAHQHLLAYKLKNTSYNGMNAMNYTFYEVQRYLESLVFEYFKKSNLDSRIVRLAEIVGNGIDLSKTTQIADFAKKAVLSQKIIVEGDGLNSNYLINLKDAVSGIVKAMFAKKTSGKIIYISNADAITTLALSYKIGEIEKNSVGVEFKENDSQNELLELVDVTQNWELINWKPKISIERSLAQTIDDVYKYFGFVSDVDKNHIQKNTNIGKDTDNSSLGEKSVSTTKDFESVSDKLKNNTGNTGKVKSTFFAKEKRPNFTYENGLNEKKTIYEDKTFDINHIKEPINNFGNETKQNKESFIYEQEIRQANLSRIISESEQKDINTPKLVNVSKVKKLPLIKRIGVGTILFTILLTICVLLIFAFLVFPITQLYKSLNEINSSLANFSSTQVLQNQINSLQSIYESQNNISKPIISQLLGSKLDEITKLNYFLKIYNTYAQSLELAKSLKYNIETGKIEFFDASNNLLNSVSANYSDYLLLKNNLSNMKSTNSEIQKYLTTKNKDLPIFAN